ncbi:hypothetical protein H4Q26_017302 [Puccinia striiformis f. sp. tritici PST-130]|nr:hypothetical protein H4Q26_017302 [Puccinia striiformis f. sp. tritici PST-130]
MGTILFQAPLHFVVFSGLGLIDIDLSLRQAPEYTMADSETESSSPTALVLRMLANLVGKYEELARREPGEEKEEIKPSTVASKSTRLLFDFARHIQDDLRNLNQTRTDLRVLSRLEQTLDQTRECVESAALEYQAPRPPFERT